MKKAEIEEAMKHGVPVVFAEYRGGKGEVINWTSKTTGRPEEARAIVHALETSGGEQFKVNERMNAGADVSNPKLPAKKGQQVVVFLRRWLVEKGNITVRGDIHPVEA